MDALNPLRTEFEGLRETENRKDRLIEVCVFQSICVM